jgi:2'-5' RNA ligase
MTPNWFIGLPVDPGRWFTPLVSSAPGFLRIFHPDDIHITVAFLGSCGEARAREAWAHVHEQIRQAPPGPLRVTLGGVRPMGNPKRPTALSVVLSRQAGPVADLMGSLREGAWAAAEARSDDRPPLPHITVARPSRRAGGAERRRAIQWALERAPIDADITLDRIALLTWAEDRQRRQFRTVEQRPLAPATEAPPRRPQAENAG